MHREEKLYQDESRPSCRNDRPVPKKLNKTKGCAPATRLHCITRRPRIACLCGLFWYLPTHRKWTGCSQFSSEAGTTLCQLKRPQGRSWQITLDRRERERERGSKKGERSLPRQGSMFRRLADTKIKPTTFLQVGFLKTEHNLRDVWLAAKWSQVGRSCQACCCRAAVGWKFTDFDDFLTVYKIPCVEANLFWLRCDSSHQGATQWPALQRGSNTGGWISENLTPKSLWCL